MLCEPVDPLTNGVFLSFLGGNLENIYTRTGAQKINNDKSHMYDIIPGSMDAREVQLWRTKISKYSLLRERKTDF